MCGGGGGSGCGGGVCKLASLACACKHASLITCLSNASFS